MSRNTTLIDCWRAGLVLPGLMLWFTALGELIPEERRIPWSREIAGVPGGIPNRTIIHANAITAGCDPTGTRDTSVILNQLLSTCPSNRVVYLPAGKYLLRFILSINRSGVVLRGEGPGKTVIIDGVTDKSHYGIIEVGANDNLLPTRPILSGYAKGSSNLVVASANDLIPGNLLYLGQSDDKSLVWSAKGLTNVLGQTTSIKSVVGNNVAIWPPVYFGLSSSLNPYFRQLPHVYSYCGIEDLTITHVHPDTGESGSSGSTFTMQTYGSWLKNVESVKTASRHFYFIDSIRCEVRDCIARDAQRFGPNGGPGLEFYSDTCGSIVENNIFLRCFPSMMISHRSNGNIFGYNYSDDVQTGTELIGGDMNCNHGPHDVMNLYEGNAVIQFQSDGFWGSSSHNTLFRNWLRGTHPTLTENRKCLDLCRWSQYFNIVGNVLGIACWPGRYEIETSGYSYSLPTIYRLGFPSMGNNRYIGTISDSIEGFDPRVKQTTIRRGNYDYASETTIWDSGFEPEQIPASLYLNGKPTWWDTDLTWPPFGPDLTPKVSRIPAQVRAEKLGFH